MAHPIWIPARNVYPNPNLGQPEFHILNPNQKVGKFVTKLRMLAEKSGQSNALENWKRRSGQEERLGQKNANIDLPSHPSYLVIDHFTRLNFISREFHQQRRVVFCPAHRSSSNLRLSLQSG
jgi:hypothetical protein